MCLSWEATPNRGAEGELLHRHAIQNEDVVSQAQLGIWKDVGCCPWPGRNLGRVWGNVRLTAGLPGLNSTPDSTGKAASKWYYYNLENSPPLRVKTALLMSTLCLSA